MKGTLHKTEDGWFVKHDGKTTPIEPNQNWWLGEQSGKQGFYKDNDEVDFEIIPYIPKDLEPTRGETVSFEAVKYARISLDEDLTIWDVTLMDGLEDEPPYISDDFQIGPDGAYEHTEEFENKLKSKKKK
jgi:hypothetical protein